jgi:CBS domain-containing protein
MGTSCPGSGAAVPALRALDGEFAHRLRAIIVSRGAGASGARFVAARPRARFFHGPASMKPGDPATLLKLPVRVRRTIGTAAAARAQLVYCPMQRVSVDIERCRECERCEGVEMEADGCKLVQCRISSPPRALRKIMPTAAEATPVGALLEREVVCVGPALSREAATMLLLERGLSGAPVVDAEGRPLGMLARSDLLRAALSRPAPATVADVMMPIAFSLGENDALSTAAGLMAAEGVHHLPIVGDFGRVVGLVTTLDVTRWLARQAGYDV